MQAGAGFGELGEVLVAQGFVSDDGDGVREVQGAGFGNHRDADGRVPMRLQERLGKAFRLLAENEHVARRELDVRVGARRLCGKEVEVVAAVHGGDFIEVFVVMHLDEVPVVEAGALEVFVVRRKAERLDEMEFDARRRAEAGNVAGVAGDFWFYEYDMQCYKPFLLLEAPSKRELAAKPTEGVSQDGRMQYAIVVYAGYVVASFDARISNNRVSIVPSL